MVDKEVSLVVARYNENLDWIVDVPPEIRIFVYNKGPRITNDQVVRRIDSLEHCENIGRESDTYLSHILSKPLNTSRFTAFVQGDPFPHSPHFIELLEKHAGWRDIQPLTVQYLRDRQIPPADLIDHDQREYVGTASARSEVYSLRTLLPFTFDDEGALWIAKNYRQGHNLNSREHLMGHFLQLTGWDELATRALNADFGRFVYGAMFAVKSENISIPPDVLNRMRVLARGHSVYGYMFERIWLHFFGADFYSFDAGAASAC